MNTWAWDPNSQSMLDYFSMMVFISPWDPSSLVYFSNMVHTYPWDPGIWLYIKRGGQHFHKGDGMLGI